MLKFFKKVFGSSQSEGDGNGSGYTTPFAPGQQQTNVAEAEAMHEGQPSQYAPASPAHAQSAYASSTGVRISLPAIIAVLPLELKTRIQQANVAGIFITLPLGRVVAQLAAGAVRMSFGELRAACPNVFSPHTDRDNLQIALPLNEILPQINPAFLPRRQAQRQVTVPDDVTGPFGNDGFGVTFAETRTITGTPVAASSEAAPEPEPIAPPPPPVAPRAVQPPKPAPLSPPSRNVQPPKAPTPPPTFVPKPPPVAPQPIAIKPPIAPKPAPIPQQPIAMKPPQAPIAQKPVPQPPAMRPPAAPIAPQPSAPAQPVPFRNPFASTPPPPAPTATPTAPPPGRPAFPAARGAGATPQPPAAPQRPPAGSNGNGHVPPQAPVQFNQFQRAPQPQQAPQVPEPPIFQRAPQPQQAPQVPEEPVVFQRAPQAPQPQFQQAPQQPISMAPQPAPSAEPETTASNESEVYLEAPLAVLSESWPDELHSEIEQQQLSGMSLGLPLGVIEPALKQGKIAFPWKVLRSWIRPAIQPTASAHDGMMLELPLKVIAPLFVARQKEAKAARQKIDLDENIPNLFFGFPQPDSGAEEPAAEPTAPAAQDEDALYAPAQKPAGVKDTNFYVWGESADTPQSDGTEFKRKQPAVGTEFLSRYATPNEIVSRAAAIEGVVGALVALPDGLMVASKLSADLNGDTLAAFLPHIFGKVSQCTKELRMGELNNLNFTVGNVPWKIFRVNSIFFAAFGRAGQPLPSAQLAALAAELDRKKQ
jgi:predicted regulator of Ras-like GTPase activity (Roadblock/LC7/MglB family)